MSYLNPLRLHFAGRFQANVSTVNNDAGHYQNDAFQSSYQDMQSRTAMNGWFNPEGDGGWRLMNCKVTAAWTPDGQVTDDLVLDYLVADSDTQVCGKLVDLDPEQQLVSEIWGLQVRICDAQGNTLLCGDFEPAAFMDIWNRATGAGSSGDTGAGAMYQSVLTNLKWGDVSGSNFLIKLKAAATNGLLSIKFNVDGVNLNFASPDFMSGRIVGTIGPASVSEPRHLLIARQFMAIAKPVRGFFTPLGGINFFPAVVVNHNIYLDLGNALSTKVPGGAMNLLGDLAVGYYDPDDPAPGLPGATVVLGTIPADGEHGYASEDWYANTAGIVVMQLDSDQLQAISEMPLILGVAGTDTMIYEPPQGAFLRADKYVYRVSPGESRDITLVATQWGQRLPKAVVVFDADPQQLQPGSLLNQSNLPAVATPLSALQNYDIPVSTLADGTVGLIVTTTDPGTPRNFGAGSYGIDGQVYGLRPKFVEDDLNPPANMLNQWNFVSILLWSGFTPATPPTWDDVEPMFQQAANLYPVMNRFLNLGDYDSVVANAYLLKLAFGLPDSDPNSMPVTRDLSPAKRQTILTWLDDPLPGTKPKSAPEAATLETVAEGTPDVDPASGGKAAAAARRLSQRT